MCLGWRPNHSDLIHRDVFLGDGAQLCKNGHLGVHGKQPHQKIDKHSTLLWNIYIYSVYSISIPGYIQSSTSLPWFVRRRWIPMPKLVPKFLAECWRTLAEMSRDLRWRRPSPLRALAELGACWAMWKMWESIGKNVENVILRVATHLNLFEPIWELWIPQFIIIPYHISVCCLHPIFVSLAPHFFVLGHIIIILPT